MNDVFSFYDFYLKFDSWRDFSHDSEHDAEGAQCRNEKRFLQKKNEVAAKKKKKKEYARLADLVDRAMAADPRLRKQKYDDKMAKNRAKQAKEDAVAAVALAAQAAEDELLAVAAAQEAVKSASNKSQKLEKDKAKKVLRKAKKLFRELMDVCREQKAEHAIDVLQTEAVCDTLSLEDLQG